MRNKNKAGLTVVEAVISISIFVLVALVIGALFIRNTQLYSSQDADTRIKISKATFGKNFQEVTESAIEVLASQSISGIVFTSSSSTAVFKLYSVNANNDLLSTFDYMVFYKSGTNVYMQTDADPTSARGDLQKLLAENVDSALFLYNNATPSSASEVKAILNFSKNNKTYNPLTAGAKLRNK